MPNIPIDLDTDVIDDLSDAYRDNGYPLGKSRRGFKKWMKRFIIKSLTEYVRKYLDNEN